MFTRLYYSGALEYSIIRRYTNIVYYYIISSSTDCDHKISSIFSSAQFIPTNLTPDDLWRRLVDAIQKFKFIDKQKLDNGRNTIKKENDNMSTGK